MTTPTVADSKIPEGWAPFQGDPVVWDDTHAAFLDVCLHLHQTLENFNPNDRTHHTFGRHGKPLPRVEWINLRENAGLTQQQLAEQLGTGQPSIARWETGIRRPDRNSAYVNWLIQQADEQAANVRMQIYMLASLRDSWWDVDANPYPHLWEAIFKPGGTYERWIETGSLPTWTPKDAGLT